MSTRVGLSGKKFFSIRTKSSPTHGCCSEHSTHNDTNIVLIAGLKGLIDKNQILLNKPKVQHF